MTRLIVLMTFVLITEILGAQVMLLDSVIHPQPIESSMVSNLRVFDMRRWNEHPKGQDGIYESSEYYGSNYFYCAQMPDYFMVYKLKELEDRSIDSMMFFDFDGAWPEELFVFSSTQSGHSNWQYGLSESDSYLTIYSLENSSLILDHQLKYELQSWWSEYDIQDEEGFSFEEAELIDSGGEYDYNCYHPLIERKKLSFIQQNYDNEYGWDSYEGEDAELSKRYEYAWDGEKLILIME